MEKIALMGKGHEGLSFGPDIMDKLSPQEFEKLTKAATPDDIRALFEDEPRNRAERRRLKYGKKKR